MDDDLVDWTDVWMHIMRQIPVANDVHSVARVCRASRTALYPITFSYTPRVALAEDLVGRHIVRCKDGMLALSPMERGLTFQLDVLPVRVVRTPIGGLLVDMHPATTQRLQRLCAWWGCAPFQTEIWCDDHCVHYHGPLRTGDHALIIVEVHRRDGNSSRPTLRAIKTAKTVKCPSSWSAAHERCGGNVGAHTS